MMRRIIGFPTAALAAFFIVSSALAQGTVTNHAFAVGKGAGVTGFTAVLCSGAQIPIGQASADPSCRTVSGDITIDNLGATTIGTAKVAAAMLQANAVTNTKLAQMANATFKCRNTTGTGDPEDCTASQVRTLLGLVIGTNIQAWDADLDALAALSSTGIARRTGANAWSVGTAVANAELATMPAYTLKCNATGSSAVPTDCTIAGLMHKASPSGTDRIPISDEAASSALKFATIAEVVGAVATGVTTVNDQSGAVVITVQPQGRLTLTSATPVTTSDVSGVSIYYALAIGNQLPIHNGSTLVHTAFAELTLALDNTSDHTGYHQSGKQFDLFVINDSGTIRLCTGPAWSSDTGRGTGAGTTELQLINGVWSNKVTLSNCRFGPSSGDTVSVPANRGTYVGSFRASADGQATDAKDKRWLYNAYNQTPRWLRRGDPASSAYAYTTASWRQCNGSSANQVDVLAGLDGVLVNVQNVALMGNSGVGTADVIVGLGIDGIAGPHTDSATAYSRVGAGLIQQLFASYSGHTGIGRHYFTCLEFGAGSGAQDWFPNGFSSNIRTGLFGMVIM